MDNSSASSATEKNIMHAARMQLNESITVMRSKLAAAMGQQHGGKRDLYDALGYERNPNFDTYFSLYSRNEYAGRIVDLPAEDTWRKPPIISDGDSSTDKEENRTPFIQAFIDLSGKLRLWHYFQRADKLAGIGRFGLLVMGLPGNAETEYTGKAPGAVMYLAPYSEGEVSVIKKYTDAQNPKFGRPEIYQITVDDGDGKTRQIKMHASRVIHIADGKLQSEVYGTPRLERVLNRIFDTEKVLGGAAEAAWITAFKGLVFALRDGYEFPDKTVSGKDAQKELLDEIDEYMHGFKRYMRTSGVDVNELGSDTIPDPSGLSKEIIKALSAGSNIPARILVGSESGELASSQDQSTWAGQIASRQTDFAEPEMLRAFIDWCISHGVLPAPSSGEYSVLWESIFELTDKEKAEVAQRNADALFKLTGGLPENAMSFPDFTKRYMDGYVLPDVVDHDTTPGAEEDEEQDGES
jgi:hypothetical protein